MAFPSWPYRTILQTSQQLAGLLDSHEEAERILGPVGPKLAAANLHPWIWNAAVDLWDAGHLREAVQACQPAVPGQEPGEGEPFGIGEGGLDRGERGGWDGSGYRAPPGRAGTGEGWASSGPSG